MKRSSILIITLFLICYYYPAQAEESLLSQEAQGYYSLAGQMYEQGRAQEAIHYYQKALLMNSGFAREAYNNIGIIYAQMAKYSEAEYNFKRALEHAPDDEIIRINLGLLFEAQGRKAVADQWWLDTYGVGRLKPKDLKPANVSNEEYFTILGLERAGKSDYVSAREDFETALKEDRDYKPAQANIAVTYENEGETFRALKWWGKYFDIEKCKPKDFVQVDVSDEQLFTKKGLMLAKERKYQQAIEQFRLAVASNADYKPAQFNLALCFEKQGRQDEANSWWVKAFGLDQRHADQYTFTDQSTKQ